MIINLQSIVESLHLRLSSPDITDKILRIECWAGFFEGLGFTV